MIRLRRHVVVCSATANYGLLVISNNYHHHEQIILTQNKLYTSKLKI